MKMKNCMAMSIRGFCILVVSVIGCVETPKPAVLEEAYPVLKATAEATPLEATVRLDDREVLTFKAVYIHVNDQLTRYQVSKETTTTQPADGHCVTYILSQKAGRPVLRFEISYDHTGGQAKVSFSSDAELPEVTLVGSTPTALLPVRVTPSSEHPMVQSAMGTPMNGFIDALFDVQRDWVMAVDGQFSYVPSEKGGDFVVFLSKPRGKSQTIVALTSRKDFLKTIQEPVEVISQPDMKDSARGIINWDDVQQLAAGMMKKYWAHGIRGQDEPVRISVNDPLTLEQARVLISLMGLSGQPVAVADEPEQQSAERAGLLGRISPPAPIRAVDLFAHELPITWNLEVFTFDRWNIVGLFNWSGQSVKRAVRFDELLRIPNEADIQFAVYDLWAEQLLAVAKDGFEVHLLPTSCRVVCIRPISEQAPTVLGTNRHITHGGIDLTDVKWDEQRLTLSGKSEVVADDPYELRILVPQGEDSFEIKAVGADAPEALVRSYGPLRMVTFQSDQTRSISWNIAFTKASQHTPPPVAPRNLAAKQNTRGVLLTWNLSDEPAVAYRIYRNNELIADVAGNQYQYQDSGVIYDTRYTYTVSAVDWMGRESPRPGPIYHKTPVPASTNLTQLVPISVIQERNAFNQDESVSGNHLRMRKRRYHRGIGTQADSKIRYFLGGGYDRLTGWAGIDDATNGAGSAVFEIIADGESLFNSGVMRGGQQPKFFSVSTEAKKILELIVTDAGDGTDNDYADWGNPYLRATPPTGN